MRFKMYLDYFRILKYETEKLMKRNGYIKETFDKEDVKKVLSHYYIRPFLHPNPTKSLQDLMKLKGMKWNEIMAEVITPRENTIHLRFKIRW